MTMNSIRNRRPLGAALCALMLLPAVAGAQPLSFEQAREQLLQRSPARAAEAHQLDAWQREADATWALRMPRVAVGVAGYEYRKQAEYVAEGLPAPLSLDAQERGVRSNLSVEWPLYTGGRIDASRGQAHARVRQADAELEAREAELTRSLVDHYFGWQLAAEVVAVREATLEALEAYLHQARRFEETGVTSRLERLQVQVRRDEARRELVAARRQLAAAEAALGSLLMTDTAVCPSTPLFVQTEFEPERAQLDVAHPGLAALEARAAQAERQTAIERAQLRPELFAFGSYELNRDAAPVTEPDWAVGLGARWQLSSGLDRRHRIGAARAREAQAGALHRQATADLALALELAQRRLLQAQEQFQLLQSDLELASENVRLQEAAFRQGRATSLELSEARVGLARAQVQRAETAYDYVTALADLLYAAGRIDNFASHAGGTIAAAAACNATRESHG